QVLLISSSILVILSGCQSNDQKPQPLSPEVVALSDSRPEVREAAASALRAKSGKNKIVDPGWIEKARQVRTGMSREEVERILPDFAHPELGGLGAVCVGGAGGFGVSYRLDEHWTVDVSYDRDGRFKKLDGPMKSELAVDIGPPTDFSGMW